MQPSSFDEETFFQAIAASGARSLLIGRRALIALGIPVLTADYDFWVHPDDAEVFNAACAKVDLHPTRAPLEARRYGRYVLENDEHVDVLLAKAVSTGDGGQVSFDDLWARRKSLSVGAASVAVPALDDLILTKKLGTRSKDAEDVRLLESLRPGPGDPPDRDGRPERPEKRK